MEKPASQGKAGGKPLTTFVHTDTNAFREVVQRLTGPSENDAAQAATAATNVACIKRSTSKLSERRHCTRPKLEIVKPPINFKPFTSPSTSRNSPLHPSPTSRNHSLPSPTSRNSSLQPSPVGTPTKVFSKLSLQEQDNKGESAVYEINSKEEEKAVKERRFYVHPSPRSRQGYTEPELLTLFPLTSNKTSEDS